MSDASDVEEVEVVAAPLRAGWLWAPVAGEETRSLLNSIEAMRTDIEAQSRVLDEARGILAHCPPPMSPAPTSETGLAIGYVQSGKTMSFTTVAALARDNGYRIVIVVTGTSLPLTRQSRDRLVADLRLSSRRDRPWLHVFSDKPAPWARQQAPVQAALRSWRDPQSLPHDRRTVLITVMKHHGHLAAVTALLRGVGAELLRDAPTLIIDDEADQAGLNTLVQQGDASTTYSRLLALKSQLPQHSYIQYTATPQAPLLINLIDVLSPRFAAILTPGAAYVGGRSFFPDPTNRSPAPLLWRVIPPSDIPLPTAPLTDPPASLLDALRIFFLGVAAGDVLEQGRGNRSMLVHPTHLRNGHLQYRDWIRALMRQWEDVLGLPETDPDRAELLREFEGSYGDLRTTVGADLPAFSALQPRIGAAIRNTVLEEMNTRSGPTPQINWMASYSFILVGGQAMDRGFTVEGLTVTYMPRGVGVGNADTVQQRARFFGYKMRYRGYCRVYLDAATLTTFEEYVTHEEDLRARLQDHARKQRPLAEWRREFLLTGMLRPTRDDILSVPYVRETVDGDQWIWVRQPHVDAEAMAENARVVDAFVAMQTGEMEEYPGAPERTPEQRPLIAQGLLLRDVFENLLTKLRFSYLQDSQRYTAAMLVLEWYLRVQEKAEAPPPRAALVQMGTDPGRRVRQRGLDDDGCVKELFQGAAPVQPVARRGTIYPGDREIRLPDRVTVQIHPLELTVGPTSSRTTVVGKAYAVAILVPRQVLQSVVLQPQGGPQT